MELDQTTLATIQRLIVANFAGRDELYAAADSLDNESQRKVCQRLAGHLADHAVELQQILTASGIDPERPVDIDMITEKLFEFAKMRANDDAVLETITEAEHSLIEEYDEALESSPQGTAQNVIRRQRDDVEFAEEVLKGMTKQEHDD